MSGDCRWGWAEGKQGFERGVGYYHWVPCCSSTEAGYKNITISQYFSITISWWYHIIMISPLISSLSPLLLFNWGDINITKSKTISLSLTITLFWYPISNINVIFLFQKVGILFCFRQFICLLNEHLLLLNPIDQKGYHMFNLYISSYQIDDQLNVGMVPNYLLCWCSRYLQTLTQISAEKNSTIIFPLPLGIYFLQTKTSQRKTVKNKLCVIFALFSLVKCITCFSNIQIWCAVSWARRTRMLPGWSKQQQQQERL